MKHRKILSALLALVLVMALTVPAFADETSDWNWNFEVAGKSDEEISVGEKTFKLHNWGWPEEDEESGTFITTKEADVSEYTASPLMILKKGDTAVITNGGEQFDSLILQAWSDPDGDGVYDQRMMKVSFNQEEERHDESIMPADTAGPLTAGVDGVRWYRSSYAILIDGSMVSDMLVGDMIGGAELRLSADTLLEKFGGNTLLFISPQGGNRGWAVLLEGGAAQPAEAGTYTVKYGDTWGQLALNNYGSYSAWRLLWKANGYKGLSTGKDIVLPEKLGSYTRLPEQVLAEGEKLYTVKAGDTLGQIAVATYKDINMYKAIFERNADRLKNANSIYEGQVLVLPVKK